MFKDDEYGSVMCPQALAANIFRFCFGPKCAAWRQYLDGEHGWCGLAGTPYPPSHIKAAQQIADDADGE